MKRRIGWIAALGLLLGCSAQQAPQAEGKVAARVNGEAITVSHGALSRDKLERVIERELLVQKATKEGLDRDPEVVRQLEEARREALAKAYLDRAGARAAASATEVARFYDENPALFAQRRIYRYQELVVSPSAEQRDPSLDLIRGELSGAKDIEQVAGWLKWRGLKVSVPATVTMAAEQLPLSYLPRLARMTDGELAVFPSPLGASVIQLVHAQEAPLAQEQAAPVIEQFLAGRKRLELAAAEVRRLREGASIEYLGEFKR
ncbi:MAG: EpsD family peptidyl-prolyl cis-trans isomerase [Clostridia bacterium]